jgi:mannose-6-phosphate isomerase-like protein (cupin superfamily)
VLIIKSILTTLISPSRIEPSQSLLGGKMFTINKANAQNRERNGLTSYFLLDRRSDADTNLAVTWVDVVPGGRQILHHHVPEQVYVIIQGEGKMQVGANTRKVSAGDLIFIPSDEPHGIVNTGDSTLCYVSAATPPFDLAEAYDRGQLQPGKYQ